VCSRDQVAQKDRMVTMACVGDALVTTWMGRRGMHTCKAKHEYLLK